MSTQINTAVLIEHYVGLISALTTQPTIGYENRVNTIPATTELYCIIESDIVSQTDEANAFLTTLFNLNIHVHIRAGLGIKKQNDLLVAMQDIYSPQIGTNISKVVSGVTTTVTTAKIFSGGMTENNYYRKTLQLKITATKKIT